MAVLGSPVDPLHIHGMVRGYGWESQLRLVDINRQPVQFSVPPVLVFSDGVERPAVIDGDMAYWGFSAAEVEAILNSGLAGWLFVEGHLHSFANPAIHASLAVPVP